MSATPATTPEQPADTHFCALHPTRETELRCNKCERYMCSECAVPTPVGYRCRQCVRQIESVFFTATPADYAILFAVSGVLAGIAGGISAALALPILFALILGLPLGGLISDLPPRLIRRRRGRYTGEALAAGVACGGLIGVFIANYAQLMAVVVQIHGGSVTSLPLDVVFQRMFTQAAPLALLALAGFAAYVRYRVRR
jgi:hypothetical protein